MSDPHEGPRVARVRHELKRRSLTVARVERLPPNMVRVALGGEELHGFTSLGFDDHIKVFFPAGQAGGAARDFTPRRHDPAAGELWIDFFLHAGGPAAAWASQAAAGQTLQIGGPKGSAIIDPDGIDTHVLIGDESALPAIGRRLEELPRSSRRPRGRSAAIFATSGDSTGGGSKPPLIGSGARRARTIRLPTMLEPILPHAI